MRLSRQHTAWCTTRVPHGCHQVEVTPGTGCFVPARASPSRAGQYFVR